MDQTQNHLHLFYLFYFRFWMLYIVTARVAGTPSTPRHSACPSAVPWLDICYARSTKPEREDRCYASTLRISQYTLFKAGHTEVHLLEISSAYQWTYSGSVTGYQLEASSIVCQQSKTPVSCACRMICDVVAVVVDCVKNVLFYFIFFGNALMEVCAPRLVSKLPKSITSGTSCTFVGVAIF